MKTYSFTDLELRWGDVTITQGDLELPPMKRLRCFGALALIVPAEGWEAWLRSGRPVDGIDIGTEPGRAHLPEVEGRAITWREMAIRSGRNGRRR